ncbi:unnamed protein product [Diabrotica balteata]|uniref:Uncharacterized protein n=1 Tax=Diabrotica balteata TaxID=107213 RepID=A0A9N9XIL4_DIABA|nr:unnamed protein product [Diabrotica balteata]
MSYNSCDKCHVKGTMRKLLYLWCFDSQSGNKLSAKDVSKISEHLLLQKSYIPSEFTRKPRSLTEVKRWKATEFRQFLFYTGPIVLKSVLSSSLYKNFLALSIACMLLTNPKYAKHTDLAQTLMKYFVHSFIVLYGEKHVSHNIHNLLHISKDVNYMGVLDKFSTFPFENILQKLKNLVRKGDNPLAQVVKRIIVINYHKRVNKVNIEIEKKFTTKRQHDKGPLVQNATFPQFESLIFNEFTLKIIEPDNCCALKDGILVTIQNFASLNGDIVIIGYNVIMKTWTVVRFLKDGSVEAVPTNWLSGNTCSWPHYEANKLGKALKNGVPPLPTWEKHEISSFRNATYDDYSIARRKCQKAEETSDLNSSDNRPGRRRPPTKFATTSSSSSESESAKGHKNTQSNLPKMPEFALSKASGDSDSLQEEVGAKESMEDVDTEYLKHILRKLNMLELIVTDLRAEVSNLSKISTSSPRELQEQPTLLNIWENFSLPLDSEEEFANFEDF